MITALVLLGLTVLAGIFYRMGGAGEEGQWYEKFLNTKWRDFGVPTVCIAMLIVANGFHLAFWWAYILTFGALFGTMTTYWKKKGTDAEWYNWTFTFLGYSVAFLPFAIASGLWIPFVLRLVVLTVLGTLWKTFIKKDIVSEIGAGVLTALSVLFFLR